MHYEHDVAFEHILQYWGQAEQDVPVEARKYPSVQVLQVTKSEQVLQLVKQPAQMLPSRK